MDKSDNFEKEAYSLRKDLKKKEKRIRDLIAELKEAVELVKRYKWEAETNGGENGVKEMAEEENEVISPDEDLDLVSVCLCHELTNCPSLP